MEIHFAKEKEVIVYWREKGKRKHRTKSKGKVRFIKDLAGAGRLRKEFCAWSGLR